VKIVHDWKLSPIKGDGFVCRECGIRWHPFRRREPRWPCVDVPRFDRAIAA
jgi:hypothetical protein